MAQEKEKKVIKITRIIIRERVKYSIPARYQRYTKLIIVTPEKEIDRYYNEKFRTYKKFVQNVKAAYGDSYTYDVDESKPYVHTI